MSSPLLAGKGRSGDRIRQNSLYFLRSVAESIRKQEPMSWIHTTTKRLLSLLLIPALAVAGLLLAGPLPALAQQDEEPEMEQTIRRGPDEGGGPYERLVIRGATMIDGTGARPDDHCRRGR